MSHRSETYVVSRGFHDHLERIRPGLGQFFPVGAEVVLDVWPGDSRFALHLPAETAGCRQLCDYQDMFDRQVYTIDKVVVLDEHPSGYDHVSLPEAVAKLWPNRRLEFVPGQTLLNGKGEEFEVVAKQAYFATLRSKKDGRTVEIDVDEANVFCTYVEPVVRAVAPLLGKDRDLAVGQVAVSLEGEEFEVLRRAGFKYLLQSLKDGRRAEFDVDFGFSPQSPPAEGMQVGTEPYQLGASHVVVEPAEPEEPKLASPWPFNRAAGSLSHLR
jgi:hypothetical protein